MRDLKAPWYIHVSANNDVEIRNSKGEFVFIYYHHDEGWCDRAIERGSDCPDEFPGADPDVIAASAEALELLREVMENGVAGDWPERTAMLLQKVDKRRV